MDAKQEALVLAEVAAKALTEAAYDKIVNLICEEIKVAIPGAIDDLIIDSIKPMVAPKLKELLLAEIAKIDGQV